jgi:hypothetical protein
MRFVGLVRHSYRSSRQQGYRLTNMPEIVFGSLQISPVWAYRRSARAWKSIQLLCRGCLNGHGQLLNETEVAMSYRESHGSGTCVSALCVLATTSEFRLHALSHTYLLYNGCTRSNHFSITSPQWNCHCQNYFNFYLTRSEHRARDLLACSLEYLASIHAGILALSPSFPYVLRVFCSL